MQLKRDQILYKEDDFVWAKIKGFAWWPAKVSLMIHDNESISW